ncbi:golgin candidate 6-like [Gastrolobium bilobum]|uniref:golgin candidate 6-like n=1 Tax=Gastrolobium bilobum TaxID=150636 RepID=UPI002AB25521|nr:golgin candidate 6-like [Gastrolobium bilobum]
MKIISIQVRGALKTMVRALTPIYHGTGSSNEVQPALINTDLLSRKAESVSLLLILLEEDDFYARYYTLQILTALVTHSPEVTGSYIGNPSWYNSANGLAYGSSSTKLESSIVI